MKSCIAFALLFTGIILLGCTQPGQNTGNQGNNTQPNDTQPEQNTGNLGGNDTIQTANPASIFCIDNGGTLDIRNEAAGQVGYCKFLDNTECEEWAYYRGECSPGGPAIAATTVSIDSYTFVPQELHIMVGTRVTWKNNDDVPHAVIGTKEGETSTVFGSITLQNGMNYSYTFNTAGNYDYHCSIHPTMTGSITVG